MIPANLVLPVVSGGAEWARVILVLIGLCVFGFGAISVCRLAALFHGKVIAVIYALALLVPLLGLIMLVTISQKATSILKQNGVKVGLLGAKPNSV